MYFYMCRMTHRILHMWSIVFHLQTDSKRKSYKEVIKRTEVPRGGMYREIWSCCKCWLYADMKLQEGNLELNMNLIINPHGFPRSSSFGSTHEVTHWLILLWKWMFLPLLSWWEVNLYFFKKAKGHSVFIKYQLVGHKIGQY